MHRAFLNLLASLGGALEEATLDRLLFTLQHAILCRARPLLHCIYYTHEFTVFRAKIVAHVRGVVQLSLMLLHGGCHRR